VSAEVAVWRWR